MKYGVLWRKTTKNIGDDMQSYAESLWYPQVDYMVDVEDLDGFHADDDEPVACIMSAWYMWHKWNWPPSKSIYPLWVGFHYNDAHRGRPRGMPSKWEYLDGIGRDYMLAHAPIGCRDPSTVESLEQRGIPAYFSGCITLTLPQREKKTPERPYVCVVGVDKAVEKGIALEIQAESPFPSERFVRKALDRGAKISFGTNNFDPVLKKLDRWNWAFDRFELNNGNILQKEEILK